MKKVKLIRHWNNRNESIGTLLIIDNNGMPLYSSIALERGEVGNKKNVSRIPAGVYPLRYTYSPKFKRKMWLVDNVPNRSGIRIHPANYYNQIQGCIVPGMKLKDINKDGLIDVTYSTITTLQFEKILKNIKETTIEIIDEY